jgi:hypothetical protein
MTGLVRLRRMLMASRRLPTTAAGALMSRSRARRVLVAATVVAIGATATACGGSSSGATQASEASLIQPPKLTLAGCQYLVNNAVPAGEPNASKAPFPPFAPDPSAIAALEHLKAHGGTGMVDGFTLPSGTVLFTGPSTSAARAGVIAPANSVLVADPVLWTDSSGGDWLAFFMICGGNNVYWLSVDQLLIQNPTVGKMVSDAIAKLKTAPPFTKTGMISLLPIMINRTHRFAWVAPNLAFLPARAQYLDF